MYQSADRIDGDLVSDSETQDMTNFILEAQVIEAPSMGLFYSLTNTGSGDDRIASRIVRAFVNSLWVDKFPDVKVNYLPFGVSDHSPLMFDMESDIIEGGKPFKFNNILYEHENDDDIVKTAWEEINDRYHMRKVWLKLKHVNC